MDVYMVLIERSSNISGKTACLDSIYFSEEDAWARIDEHSNWLYGPRYAHNIIFAEFRNKTYTVVYHNEVFGIKIVKYIIKHRRVL